MSLDSVRDFFAEYRMEDRIMVLEESTATVAEAAEQHKVDPDQIGKTLSFKVDDKPVLIVASGNSKIDNRKYKSFFGKKAKMLSYDEALEYTGHAVGGICPFGLKNPIDVYLDISLKRFNEVIPAAGSSNSSIRLSISELEKYSNCRKWIDVCKAAE